MKWHLQFLFFLLLVTQFCFAQWYQQNSGTNKNLQDVIFLDANKGFAIGEGGVIIQTTDGGNTWVSQESGTTISLNSICFVDENNGWIIGGEQTGNSGHSILLHTSDGGSNWIIELTNTNGFFNDICFPSPDIGIICGGTLPLWYSLILRTTDGGISWVETVDSTNTFPMQHICFTDDNTGWSIDYTGSHIMKTSDGGLNWSFEFQFGGSCGGGVGAVDFLDPNYGIIVSAWSHGTQEEGDYAKTTDGGETWEKRRMYNDFRDIKLINANFGVALATTFDSLSAVYIVIATYDAGENWEIQMADRDEITNRICFIDEFNGWIVGDNGKIFHTANGGVSSVDDATTQPKEFILSQNYPNPFNPSTIIKYLVPQTSKVQIKIFNVLGNEIETLINEEKPFGTYELTWNAANIPSGVYFYQLRAGDYTSTKKMILLK